MPKLQHKKKQLSRGKSESRCEPGLKGRGLLNRIIEDDFIQRVSLQDYQRKVRRVYGGHRGMLLSTASTLSLHLPLGERFFKLRKFDLRGCRQILDVGCGAGQLSGHVLKFADPQAQITCFDLAPEMVRRARRRLKSDVPNFLAADLTRLPFADSSFDCITCGYVLEHLPDPRPGLAELARVLQPGGRMLLITSEDNFGGAWTSRMWHCRTYNRRELRETCESLGLHWARELWFTRVHEMLKAGGICVQIEKRK